MKNLKLIEFKSLIVLLLVLFSASVNGQLKLMANEFDDTNACLFKANDGLLKKVNGGDYIVFNNVNLNKGYRKIDMQYASEFIEAGSVEVREDGVDGNLLATLNILPSTDWQTLISVTDQMDETTTGIKNIVFLFKGGIRLGNFKYFMFKDPIDVSLNDKEMNGQHSSLYPNPTTGIIYLSKGLEIRSISIQSLKGETLLYQDEILDQIDIAYLPAGVYIVKVEYIQGVSVHKIIKR